MIIVSIILLLIAFLLIGSYTLYCHQQRTQSGDDVDITDEFELDFSSLEVSVDTVNQSEILPLADNECFEYDISEDLLKYNDAKPDETGFNTNMPVATVLDIAKALAQSGNMENAKRYLKPINALELTKEERKQYDNIIETFSGFNNEKKNGLN